MYPPVPRANAAAELCSSSPMLMFMACPSTGTGPKFGSSLALTLARPSKGMDFRQTGLSVATANGRLSLHIRGRTPSPWVSFTNFQDSQAVSVSDMRP